MTLLFSMVHENDNEQSVTQEDCKTAEMKVCPVYNGSAIHINGRHKQNFVVACENKDGMQYIPKSVEVMCTKNSGDEHLVDLINYSPYEMKVARPNSKTDQYQVFGFFMDNKNDDKRHIYITLDCSEPAADNKPIFSIKNDQTHQCGPNGGGGSQTYQEVIDAGIIVYDKEDTYDWIQCKNTQNNCYR